MSERSPIRTQEKQCVLVYVVCREFRNFGKKGLTRKMQEKKGVFDLIKERKESFIQRTGEKPKVLFLGRAAAGALAKSLQTPGHRVTSVDKGTYDNMFVYVMQNGALDHIDVA